MLAALALQLCAQMLNAWYSCMASFASLDVCTCKKPPALRHVAVALALAWPAESAATCERPWPCNASVDRRCLQAALHC